MDLSKIKFLTTLCSWNLLFLMHLVNAKDPCQPNPCGDNSLCISQTSTLISCSCLPGYEQTSEGCYKDRRTFLADLDPSDYFQDEEENERFEANIVKKEIDAPEVNGQNENAGNSDETSTRRNTRFPSNEERPSVLPGSLGRDVPRNKPVVFDTGSVRNTNLVSLEDPNDRSTRTRTTTTTPTSAEHDEVVNPRFFENPFKRPPGLKKPKKGDNLDNLFPEECLVNPDCPLDLFCHPDTLKCIGACDQEVNVCAENALCKARLHRPVCYCPDGFRGNPYEQCERTPSRVGLKFRKK